MEDEPLQLSTQSTTATTTTTTVTCLSAEERPTSPDDDDEDDHMMQTNDVGKYPNNPKDTFFEFRARGTLSTTSKTFFCHLSSLRAIEKLS